MNQVIIQSHYLNKALEIDPKHIDAFIFKGQSLYGLGNLTRAKYYFDKALEIDANNELAKRIYNNLIKKQINSYIYNNLIFIVLLGIRYVLSRVLVIKPLESQAGGRELLSTPIRSLRDWL